MNQRVRRGTKIMRVVVTSKEKKLADMILVSMEQTALGQRLFAARTNEMEAGPESEMIREKMERERARRN